MTAEGLEGLQGLECAEGDKWETLGAEGKEDGHKGCWTMGLWPGQALALLSPASTWVMDMG